MEECEISAVLDAAAAETAATGRGGFGVGPAAWEDYAPAHGLSLFYPRICKKCL
jgi:hypothetical protein